MTEQIREQSNAGLTLTAPLTKGEDMIGSVSTAGVTLGSEGQTPTHLGFLIGYVAGSQVLLLVYGCGDMRC